jgi:hypothetical protein
LGNNMLGNNMLGGNVLGGNVLGGNVLGNTVLGGNVLVGGQRGGYFARMADRPPPVISHAPTPECYLTPLSRRVAITGCAASANVVAYRD